MLNTHIFITDPLNQNGFKRISGNGLSPCFWELEIINHERVSWLKNILNLPYPNYETYLEDIINIEV